jgi:hypothetical protein
VALDVKQVVTQHRHRDRGGDQHQQRGQESAVGNLTRSAKSDGDPARGEQQRHTARGRGRRLAAERPGAAFADEGIVTGQVLARRALWVYGVPLAPLAGLSR